MNTTFEFTVNHWQNAGSDYFLILTFNEPLDFKPMIQIYMYPPETETVALALEGVPIKYIEGNRMISINVTNPFNGYVVVR